MTTGLLIAALATACSSSNNATGTGGSSAAGTTGTAGTTGAAGTTGGAGTGGTGGSAAAGTTGTGGSAPTDGGVADAFVGTPDAHAPPYAAACASTVKNRGACMTATDVQCANTCGPNKSGYKNCDCYSDVSDCPRCEYVPGDYSCYKLPDPPEACPVDPNDAGQTLPQVGTACTRPPCTPCGSATIISYLDSDGSSKAGYCVCGNDQKWTCASATEWPK